MTDRSRPLWPVPAPLLAGCLLLSACGVQAPPTSGRKAQAERPVEPASTRDPNGKSPSTQPVARQDGGTSQAKVDLGQTVEITRKKFDSIQWGMSEKELRDLLGKPTVDGVAEKEHKAMSWN